MGPLKKGKHRKKHRGKSPAVTKKGIQTNSEMVWRDQEWKAVHKKPQESRRGFGSGNAFRGNKRGNQNPRVEKKKKVVLEGEKAK